MLQVDQTPEQITPVGEVGNASRMIDTVFGGTIGAVGALVLAHGSVELYASERGGWQDVVTGAGAVAVGALWTQAYRYHDRVVAWFDRKDGVDNQPEI